MVDTETEKNTDLVFQAQQGDEEAFSHLVEKHYMTIYKIAYKWCGVKEDAEDITQDVCIKLARNIRSFRRESSFSTWLYRMTVNSAKDFFRSNKKHQRGYVDMEEQTIAEDTSQEEQLAVNDIYNLIRQLPDKQRDTVMLVLCDGLSHKQAAEILVCAETTISWRIFNAKKILKQKLAG